MVPFVWDGRERYGAVVWDSMDPEEARFLFLRGIVKIAGDVVV